MDPGATTRGLQTILALRRKRSRAVFEVISAIIADAEAEDSFQITVELPASLVNDVDSDGKWNISDFQAYVQSLRIFNAEQLRKCLKMLQGIETNSLKHRTLNCLTFSPAFDSLTGLSRNQFFLLLATLETPLSRAFSASPMQENASSSASAMSVCEIRMKFFLTLLRLRHAVSFSAMEAQFGWAGSAIQQWIKRMLKVLHGQLRPFHKGFLSFMGNSWQRNQIEQWKAFHVDVAQDYDRFIERIENQNKAVAPNAVIDLHSFVGSIGAIDGTYSVTCRLETDSNDIDEEGNQQDRNYTNYKRCHAHKLLLLTSHFDKYILALEVAPGSAPDSGLYNGHMFEFLRDNLIEEAVSLGDNAFQSAMRIIAPYPTMVQTSSHRYILQVRENLNSSLSRDRMVSEHGNRSIKGWAVVRGRSDHVLFVNEDDYREAVEICWALHNFRTFYRDRS